MTLTLYGIPNCDTVKKARTWLDQRGLEYRFVDYKKVGADPARLADWCDVLGWEKVLNRAGTTFRKLPDEQREGLDRDRAIAVMVANPSCIKRPIVEHDGGLLAGFNVNEWQAVLG